MLTPIVICASAAYFIRYFVMALDLLGPHSLESWVKLGVRQRVHLSNIGYVSQDPTIRLF